MSKLRNSRIPIQEMIFALPADEWQLRLVPDDDHQDLIVKSPIYTRGQLINAVGFLRHENWRGYHILGRPLTFIFEDALIKLNNGGSVFDAI